jgi:hypothetical protein
VGHTLEIIKVGVATIKGGPAMHAVSESGTAFAGLAGPSMPPMLSVTKTVWEKLKKKTRSAASEAPRVVWVEKPYKYFKSLSWATNEALGTPVASTSMLTILNFNPTVVKCF